MFKLFLNFIKLYFWKILDNFFKFLCKFFINFSKVFDEYIFAECFPRTELMATLLQYKTWEEFMYEILFDVPLEPKFWLRPCLAPQILRSRKPYASHPITGLPSFLSFASFWSFLKPSLSTFYTPVEPPSTLYALYVRSLSA